jgi:hypothetical protein
MVTCLLRPSGGPEFRLVVFYCEDAIASYVAIVNAHTFSQ